MTEARIMGRRTSDKLKAKVARTGFASFEAPCVKCETPVLLSVLGSRRLFDAGLAVWCNECMEASGDEAIHVATPEARHIMSVMRMMEDHKN